MKLNVTLVPAKYLLLILSLTISCAKTKLTNTNRGKYHTELTKTTDAFGITGSVRYMIKSPEEKKEDKPKTFFDLPDTVAITFLQAIASKSINKNDIIDAMKQPLSLQKQEEKKRKFPPIKDENKTVFPIRISISISKKPTSDPKVLHPNTRLHSVSSNITIPDSHFHKFFFYSLDKIENDYEIIDFGTLSRTNSVTVSYKAGLGYNRGSTSGNNLSEENNDSSSGLSKNNQTLPSKTGQSAGTFEDSNEIKSSKTNSSSATTGSSRGITAQAEFANSNTETINEEVAAKLNLVSTGYSFSSKTVQINQNGFPNVGISKNVEITLSVKARVSKTRRYLDFDSFILDDGKAKSISEIIIQPVNYVYIPCTEDFAFSALGNYNGYARFVLNTRKTNNREFDDKVLFQALTPGNFTIMADTASRFEYCSKLFAFQYKRTSDGNKKDSVVYDLCIDNGDPEILYIKNNVHEFKGWLFRTMRRSDETVK